MTRRVCGRPWLLGAALVCAVLVLGSRPARAVSEDEMYAAWGQAAQQFEAAHPPLPADRPEARWVAGVGGRIVSAWPDRRWITHSFRVIESAEPGAWSYPVSPVQHTVYVTTDLLAFLRARGDDHADDLLAGVLGHEIAHLMRDHHLLRHRRAEMLGLEVPTDLAQWPARVLGVWQNEDEFEADNYGAFYALHAGYRFQGMVQFLALYLRRYGDDRVLDASADTTPRVHPSVSARISQLQQERAKIEEAQQLFDRGLDFLRVGAWDAARACFAQVRNTFLLSPTVVHNLAYAELKQYESSLPAGPPLPQSVSTSYVTDPLRFRGPRTAAAEALLAEAKADFLKACDLDPKGGFLPPRLGLACIYLYEGDDAKAQATLQEVKVGVDEPGYLNLVAALAERAGDAAAARRGYAKALNLAPQAGTAQAAAELQQARHPYLPALYNLARLCESQGEGAEAVPLYRLYLNCEGSRSSFGVRAREGLLRGGGQLPPREEPEVVDSFQGIDLGASGPLVIEAALGGGVRPQRLGRAGLSLYQYPRRGITVLLTPGLTGDPVVTCVALAAPCAVPIAGVTIGDSAAALQEKLGRPREVAHGEGEDEWWDYARLGLAFEVADGRVRRCLARGRR